jgi:hypothetical protein
MAWYRAAMPAWGYREKGHGKNWAGEIENKGVRFESLNVPGLELQLSFQSIAPGRTHVLYVAKMVTLPRRPAESYLGQAFDEVETSTAFPSKASLQARISFASR